MKEMDFCEYSTDALAQAAYVTNDGYTTNVLTGGTASASTTYDGSRTPSKALDGDTATQWTPNNSAFPQYWQYDLGSGVTKKGNKSQNIYWYYL